MNRDQDRETLDVAMMVAFFAAGLFLGSNYSKFGGLLKDFIGALATLAAAFLGSWYAFRLQREKDERKERGANAEAANLALFELVRTHNKFLAIRNQFVDPHRLDMWRYLLIPPATGFDYKPMSINYSSISFLFLSTEPNILGELTLLEQDIVGTLDVMAQRSRMHVEDLQPAVETLSGGNPNAVVMPLQIVQAIGPRKAKQLRDLTNYMIDGVDQGITQTAEKIAALHRVCSAALPGLPLIKMV